MLPFRRILFPVDFSEPCARMAAYMSLAAAHFSAELTLAHALPLPSYPPVGAGTPLDPIPADELRVTLESRLIRFAEDHLPGGQA